MASASGGEPVSPDVRVVRVKAVADEAFREANGWSQEIREHVAWSDERLRGLAGVGLELVEVGPWTTHRGRAMALLLEELRAGVAKGGADVVIGFTGQPPPATAGLPGGPSRSLVPFEAGIALSLGDRAVVRRDEARELTRRTLIHEVVHLFGGLHVEAESLLVADAHRMSLRLDPFNRRVLELTRGRDFGLRIQDTPREVLAALVGLYREAPLRGAREPDTGLRIAGLLLLAGEVEEALEALRSAVAVAPGPSRDVLRHGIIPELEARAEERAPTTGSRYVLAQAYSLVERWADAAAQLRPGCRPPVEDPPSCALLGTALLKAGELGGAEEALLSALRRDGSLAGAHATLARVLSAAGRPEEALPRFGRALELAPADSSLHFDAGLASLAAGKPGAAEASFREALRLDEGRDDARARLALALARQGRVEEARALAGALERRPLPSASLRRDLIPRASRYERGRLAYAGEDYAGAAEWLGPFVGGGEAGSSAHFMLGRSLFELGRFEAAEEPLRAAIRKRPDDGDSFYYLARVLLELGRDEEARRELELASRSRSLASGKREDVHLRLARLLAAAGEGGKAEEHASAALALGGAGAAGGASSPTPSADRIELVRVTPSLAKPLARGREVRIAATVRYHLESADRGTVFLAPQDESGTTLVRPQPRAVVARGGGEATLEATITTPASGASVLVFVALHGRGEGTSSAVARARYTLE